MKPTTLAATAAISFALAMPAMAQDFSFKMATDSGAKGSEIGNALELWAQKIETGTDGHVSVDIFYQNELGGQQEVFDLLIANDVQLMINWPMTTYDERISIIYAPYMFATWDEALTAYGQGGWANEMLSGVYDDLGLKFLGAWPEGFNGIASKGGYATDANAASAFKIRVPPITPMAETVQAMGYQTATVDWAELFTAIQTGVVDGDGANVIYWDYEFFRDTLDYFTRTNHQFNTGIITMNADAFAALPEDYQAVVLQSAQEIMDVGFAGARDFDQKYADLAVEAGMEIITLTPEQISGLARKVREDVWPVLEQKVGAEIMETVRRNASQF